MEDSIQVIVGIIISVFIFFVFPVYMAYEKLDDISYVLAMRYTQDFVDNVRNKGYITKSMYEEYKSKLRSTGNSYDIQLLHKKTRIDPIAQYYETLSGGKYSLVKTSTYEYKENQEQLWANQIQDANPDATADDIATEIRKKYNAYGIHSVLNTHLYEQEVYTTKDIESALNTENKLWLKATSDTFTCIDSGTEDLNTYHPKVIGCEYAYTMNKNDNFSVTLKNTNTTVATAIYNMITVNTVDNNTRIYVNYGGTIISEKWYGKIDYKKMKHDTMNLEKKIQISILGDTIKFDDSTSPKSIYPLHIEQIKDREEYVLEFEAKPFEITDVREKGYNLKSDEIADDGLYNIVIGTGNTAIGSDNYLSISIGLNGVSILATDSGNTKVVLSYPITISGYKKFKIEVAKAIDNKYTVKLYIDNIKVDETAGLTNLPIPLAIGSGYLKVGGDTNKLEFNGYVRNAFIYY